MGTLFPNKSVLNPTVTKEHTDNTISMYMAQRHLLLVLNNLKRDPLETQHPKLENSRQGFIKTRSQNCLGALNRLL